MAKMRPALFTQRIAKDKSSAKYPNLWDGLVLACLPQDQRRTGNLATVWDGTSYFPPARSKKPFGDSWVFNGASLSVIYNRSSYVGVDGQPRSVVLGVSRASTHTGYVFDQGSNVIPYKGNYCYADGDKFYFGGGVVGFEVASASTSVDIGYSFAYTHVGTVKTLYTNGEYTGTTTYVGDTFLKATASLYLGKSQRASVPFYYFNGNIYYLYFYSRAISVKEMRMFADGLTPFIPKEKISSGALLLASTAKPWLYRRSSSISRPYLQVA